ncbi:hypothetical protein RQP46_003844 [Phenoliferia psychrophenolica]
MHLSLAGLTSLVVLAASPLAAVASSSSASFATGSINLTRDYQVEWSKEWYDDTPSFCTGWHAECKQYISTLVGAVNYEIDCVFDQPGPKVYAWCGGELAVTPGIYTDFTQNLMRFVHASMQEGPASAHVTKIATKSPKLNNPATVIALKLAHAQEKAVALKAKSKAAAKKLKAAEKKRKAAAAKKARAAKKALSMKKHTKPAKGH